MANLNPPSTGGSAPAAPTGISIDYVSSAPFFEIHWTDPAGTDFGIELWTSVDGGGSAIETGGIGEGTMLAIAAGAIADTHVYIYKVRATNAFGASAFSASITNDIFYDAVYYNPFEQSAGSSKTATVDTAGFGSMTEQGGTVSATTGKKNNASAFTSAAGHYLKSASASGSAFVSSDFTLCLWAYVTALPSSGAAITGRPSDGMDLPYDLTSTLGDDGNVYWKGVDGDAPAVVALGALNSWHLTVYIFEVSTGTSKVSVDGGAFSDNGGFGSTPSEDNFLIICGDWNGEVLNGRIDELCIWPRALSQAEVTSLYGGGTAPRFK